MSKSDQFRQYAREAMPSACFAKTDEVKQDLREGSLAAGRVGVARQPPVHRFR